MAAHNRIDLIGKKFGRLTVLSVSHIDTKYRLFWNCECECGKQVIVRGNSLKHKNTKSCGCYSLEISIKNGKRRLKLEIGDSLLLDLYGSYKRGAKKRNLVFNITFEHCVNLYLSRCYYCNIEPKQIYQRKNLRGKLLYNGIDRLNNNIGYIKENCVSCCKICNYAKGKMSYIEFIAWIQTVYNNKKETTNESSNNFSL